MRSQLKEALCELNNITTYQASLLLQSSIYDVICNCLMLQILEDLGEAGGALFSFFWRETTDPYESVDKLQIVANNMDIQQSEGRVTFSAKEFNIFISSLEYILKNYSLKLPTDVMGSFISSLAFQLDITMDWECESGNPLNHYLYALPSERDPHKTSTILSILHHFHYAGIFLWSPPILWHQ